MDKIILNKISENGIDCFENLLESEYKDRFI